MLPTPSDVHVNAPLTNISIAFMQSADAFVADKVFPTIPVSKQSDRYYTYDRGYWNRDEMEKRAPGTRAPEAGYAIDNTPTYFADVWHLSKPVADETRANADAVLNLDREATEYLTLKGMIRREKSWVSRYFGGGIWTFDYDGVAGTPSTNEVKQWNDAASTPIEDIRLAITTVQKSTGFRPNTLTLGREVYDKLLDHPDIVDRIGGGSTTDRPALVTRRLLAQIWELDNVYVMEAIENTAKEGAANSHGFIGGKKALVSYRPASPGLMTPAAGYTFVWTGLLGSGAQGGRILTMRDDLAHKDVHEIQLAFDQKLVSADLGFFFDSIVA